MIIPQPASPAAFCCIKNKKKIKGISKIQHINIRTKKGAKKRAKKEPNREEEGRLGSKERRGEK